MSKGAKIDHLRELITQSEAVESNITLSADRWEAVLGDLDEDKIDELLLMLREEAGMLNDGNHEEARKLAMNKANHLRTLEKLRQRAENLSDNQAQ